MFKVLAIQSLTQKSLIHYLKKRHISVSIAQQYVKEIHYHVHGAMALYYGVGIACGDGFEVRSPFFKGFIGTQKGMTSINLKSGQSLSIFE